MNTRATAFVFALSILSACTFDISDTAAPNLDPKETDHVALSTTEITPVVDVNSITPGHPDSKVYPPEPGSTTLANDIGYAEQRIQNQVFTIGAKLMSLKVIPYSFADDPDAADPSGPFVVGPPSTYTSSTFNNSPITIDVTDVQVGDDIKVKAFGNWQLNASSSPGDVVGRMRIRFVDDIFGGLPVEDIADGRATIADDGGSTPLPHNEPYYIGAVHRATLAGTTRIEVQVATEDLTGGAGTGTIVLLFSARMDVDHVVNN